jgi:triacylglycerol lipase
MNLPIPSYYDPENARQLAGFAADAYSRWGETQSNPKSIDGSTESRPTVIENETTDTRAVVYQSETDIVAAFRGTQSLRNFVTDICARRVALTAGGPDKAEVHEGFQRALNSVYDALLSAVEDLASGPNPPRLWITGHSLGAALAKLFAWRIANLKSEISNALAGVYTFGEPRVGNAAFRDCYDALLKPCTFRVVDGEDFITRIPWLLGAYRHSGIEVFYSAFSLQPSAFQIDPPWWVKGVSDVFGTWQEYHAGHRLALLADHHVGNYVELLSTPDLNPNPNLNPVLSSVNK